MKKTLFITLLLTSILLFGCTQKSESETCALDESYACTEETKTEIKTGTEIETEIEEKTIPMTALDTAKEILTALKSKSIETLTTYIKNEGKVRFSPYSYVNTETDVMLNAQELTIAFQSSWKTITRGSYDWSGEPIKLSFSDYLDRFIYDLDFFNAPQVIENQDIMRGNTINNAFDIYTDAHIIEFHIPWIDIQYDGMDWRSLILVLEKTDEKRNLIGIIHNQRTI